MLTIVFRIENRDQTENNGSGCSIDKATEYSDYQSSNNECSVIRESIYLFIQIEECLLRSWRLHQPICVSSGTWTWSCLITRMRSAILCCSFLRSLLLWFLCPQPFWGTSNRKDSHPSVIYTPIWFIAIYILMIYTYIHIYI